MSVLTIRAHRRYALKMPAKLRKTGGKPAACLLIELSQHGARISNLGERTYAQGEEVELHTDCGKTLGGIIRWAHDGLAGVQLARSLHLPELSELLQANRQEMGAGNLPTHALQSSAA